MILSSWGIGNCNTIPKNRLELLYIYLTRIFFFDHVSNCTSNKTGKECGCVWDTHFKKPGHNFGSLQICIHETFHHNHTRGKILSQSWSFYLSLKFTHLPTHQLGKDFHDNVNLDKTNQKFIYSDQKNPDFLLLKPKTWEKKNCCIFLLKLMISK